MLWNIALGLDKEPLSVKHTVVGQSCATLRIETASTFPSSGILSYALPNDFLSLFIPYFAYLLSYLVLSCVLISFIGFISLICICCIFLPIKSRECSGFKVWGKQRKSPTVRYTQWWLEWWRGEVIHITKNSCLWMCRLNSRILNLHCRESGRSALNTYINHRNKYWVKIIELLHKLRGYSPIYRAILTIANYQVSVSQ
jgi:hypothetical protein